MSGKFPGPYLNDVKKDESMMQYVPMEKTDIGARASGMPKNVKSESTSIEHVENRKTGG